MKNTVSDFSIKNVKLFQKIFLTTVFLLFSVTTMTGQKQHISVRDSIDGAIDLSDYIIYAHGFIVVPTIITEPALGGIGGAIVPVFLKKHAPVIDENGKKRIVNPDITGGIGMYTGNKSWMAGAFRSGSFIKARMTYKVMAGYGDINMSFYENLPTGKDLEFKFNFKSFVFYTQVLKQFRNPKWSAGPQYLLLDSKIKLPGDNLPSFLKPKDFKSTVSQFGGAIQFDGRDNIFTPDKGIRLQSDFFWSDDILGSDYDAWRVNLSAIGYHPITKKLIGGLRIEGEQAFGSPPFYLLPGINLRGVPMGRYQGKTSLVSEVELRWDLYRRWSLMGYAGVASAFNDWDKVFDKPVVYNYGTGFRYLLARKFKLRMGVDVAKGPEDWAYYIVFGSNWMR
ncbi:BamA/TamA family outer membrane protein [Flavobacterium sp. Fl-318]|uniref:BamA/TamA family outer membrane protein n=1 Tax=Flavobacterium cupriresistens TaxID=2893885 RepID=A0ABU4RGJ2_9FLAO|nr:MULTISPECIES: BamA/TamA family outer membrane protein [unclassified Flavobacterium]MDX6190585.1 BamA/TamA family outer membrane protein [Flavobacterium sp. Fl-318]UFH43645.1 BamA/TamA family outer membrane protein [Flavobacterium sp. F-323]